jgi:hypothetical protein
MQGKGSQIEIGLWSTQKLTLMTCAGTGQSLISRRPEDVGFSTGL